MPTKPKIKLKYKRVLLKLSGESLSGTNHSGIDTEVLNYLTSEIKKVYELGVQVGIVIGGGNIYRGLSAHEQGIDAVTGDYMGMLATVINSLALQNALEIKGVPTRMLSAIDMNKVAEPFIRRRAMRHLEKGRIVLFAAGTGNPFFTTDTAGVLRALEINAELILKGTRVDGVYDKDPEKNQDADMFASISFNDALKNKLKAMDMTAFALCQENNLPIIVFNMNKKDNFKNIILGKKVGTFVHN